MNNSKFIFETEAKRMIKRQGIDDLLDFLHESDFFTAPASTKYHGAREGALVEHSLSVYRWMFDIRNALHNIGRDICISSEESMAIVSLFHDVCKIYTYVVDYRNVKDPETGVWTRQLCYRFEDNSGFGAHGAKSVYIINQFMKLTKEETISIFHHMGAWDKSTYSDPGKAYETYPLAWLLHIADEASTYIDKI